MKPKRLSWWALVGGGITLCVGIVSLLTFESYLEEGEELAPDALSELFDFVVTGAFIGLIVGVVHKLFSRIKVHWQQRPRHHPEPR